jgi:hypothetical protein
MSAWRSWSLVRRGGDGLCIDECGPESPEAALVWVALVVCYPSPVVVGRVDTASPGGAAAGSYTTVAVVAESDLGDR